MAAAVGPGLVGAGLHQLPGHPGPPLGGAHPQAEELAGVALLGAGPADADDADGGPLPLGHQATGAAHPLAPRGLVQRGLLLVRGHERLR